MFRVVCTSCGCTNESLIGAPRLFHSTTQKEDTEIDDATTISLANQPLFTIFSVSHLTLSRCRARLGVKTVQFEYELLVAASRLQWEGKKMISRVPTFI